LGKEDVLGKGGRPWERRTSLGKEDVLGKGGRP